MTRRSKVIERQPKTPTWPTNSIPSEQNGDGDPGSRSFQAGMKIGRRTHKQKKTAATIPTNAPAARVVSATHAPDPPVKDCWTPAICDLDAERLVADLTCQTRSTIPTPRCVSNRDRHLVVQPRSSDARFRDAMFSQLAVFRRVVDASNAAPGHCEKAPFKVRVEPVRPSNQAATSTAQSAYASRGRPVPAGERLRGSSN